MRRDIPFRDFDCLGFFTTADLNGEVSWNLGAGAGCLEAVLSFVCGMAGGMTGDLRKAEGEGIVI